LYIINKMEKRAMALRLRAEHNKLLLETPIERLLQEGHIEMRQVHSLLSTRKLLEKESKRLYEVIHAQPYKSW